uniref:Putative replication protein A1 n=1 Tax=Arabidopsis thaliana TaxID=3702 RepID=Q8S8A1_ARATH|nr:putative replication protein A1 [Arabidopsis thaliana]
MYAAVRREQIKKFERCLTEGVWKIITTITLNPTSGQYRISDLKYKIGFVFKTTISPCDTVSDALFLSLAKFDVILSRSANSNILHDSRIVSNSFDVSQVFVDPTLAELGLFKQSIPTDGLTLGSSGSFHKRLYAPKTGDDDGDYPRQTIKEVLTSSDIGRGTIFVVVLTTRRLSKRKLSNLKMSSYLRSQDFGVKYAMVLQKSVVAKENIFGGYDSFTVVRVYTGNIADEIVQEDSDAYVDPSSLISIEHV